MADYAKLAATAQRLINKNGRDMTLTLRDRTAADPAKPWEGPASPGTDTSVTVKGVHLGYLTEEKNGVLTRSSYETAYVAALDTDPAVIETYDTLVDGSDVWHIQDVEKLAPGDTRILYILQLSGV